MAKFIYRMQSVLDIKLKLESQAKMQFAAAKMRLDEEEEKLSVLFGRKAAYEEEGRKLRNHKLNVRDIRDNRTAISNMDSFIEEQKVRVAVERKNVEAAREELQEVMQERKTHEKLKEKSFEEYCLEENKKESKEIDELVSYTYGQKRMAEAGGKRSV